MKEELKTRLKEDWIIIFISTFVSILANYGFLNILNTGVAFNIGETNFWTKTILPLCVIILVSIGIIYGIIFLVDKFILRKGN